MSAASVGCLLRLRDRLLILLLERRDLLARLVQRDIARLCKGLCGLLARLVGVAGVARQQLPDRIYRGVVEGLRISPGGAHLTLDRVERIGVS